MNFNINKFLNSFLLITTLTFVNSCGSSTTSQTNQITFNNLEISIYDDTPINTILDKQLTIINAPANLSVVMSLSGGGSNNFRVDTLSNFTTNTNTTPIGNNDPNIHYTETVDTASYYGNITLINSLEGKGGTTYTLKALALLGGGDIDSILTIHVLSRVTNTPPSISIVEDNQTVEVNSTLTLTTNANDAQGDDISYQWYYQRQDNTTKQNGGTLPSFTHKFTEIGVYRVSVVATDTKGDSNQSEVSITVEGIKNKPPVAIIGISIDANEKNITSWIGAKVKGLESSYSYDLDGNIVECKWLDESDNLVKLTSNKDCDLTDLIFDSAGSYDYTLSITDNSANIATNIAHITIEDNSIPNISIDGGNNIVANPNTPITFISHTTDNDGDDIAYWWRSINLDTNTTAITAIQSFTGGESRFDYTFSSIGLYKVEFHAQDSKGAEAVKSVDVNVTN